MPTLPGNEEILRRLRLAAGRNALSHAILFTGSGDRLAAARFAAAAFECSAEGERPCGVCPGCRKVAEGNGIVRAKFEHDDLAAAALNTPLESSAPKTRVPPRLLLLPTSILLLP